MNRWEQNSRGIAWEDARQLYVVEGPGTRTLYFGPDRRDAASIADFATDLYGQPFAVERALPE